MAELMEIGNALPFWKCAAVSVGTVVSPALRFRTANRPRNNLSPTAPFRQLIRLGGSL